MKQIAIIPISSEPPFGFTHKKCNQDEATFKKWCKSHFIDIIAFQNVPNGILERQAAICLPCPPFHELEHPTIDGYPIEWHPTHTKPIDFQTAKSRIK